MLGRLAVCWAMAACAHATGVYTVFPALPFILDPDSSGLCKEHYGVVRHSMQNHTLWSYQMWDASAKADVGLLGGNTYELGNYDQCLKVNGPISIQYCLIELRITIERNSTGDPFAPEDDPYESVYDKIYYSNDPAKIRRDNVHWGLCVPASCSSEDLQKSIQKYLDKNFDRGLYSAEVNQENCFKANEVSKFTSADLGFCVLVAGILMIVAVSSVYHSFMENNDCSKTKMSKLLLCFSIKQNYSDLMKADTEHGPLQILNGVRFTLMVCTSAAHSVLQTWTGSITNYADIEHFSRNVAGMFLSRGEVIIDTFIMMGGLLATYNYMTQSEKRKLNVFKSVVLRYFRLMPVFALVTFFYATVFDKLSSGPLWNAVAARETSYCRENWWTNLLTVNNYVNVEHMCILQGWFIPCDFHFFVVALFLNGIIRRNRKIGLGLLAVVFVVLVGIPMYITYLHNIGPFYFTFNTFFYHLRANDVFKAIYAPTHTRASPYVVGMFIGYAYYKVRDTNFKIPNVPALLGIFLCTVTGLASIFIGMLFINPYVAYTNLEAAIFAALNRPVFSLATGLGMFIVSYCDLPFAALFNWKISSPLAKLSYGAFLSHMAFQLIRVASMKTPSHFDYITMSSNIISDISLAMLFSFVLFLTVENPVSKLMRELLPKDEPISRNSNARVSKELFTKI